MTRRTLEQHTQALADYMPNGKLFEAKNINNSNFRQLLRGLAGELFTAQGYLITLEQEYFPDQTNLFLSEWESALGIPDSCFGGIGSNEIRRRDIITKLSALGVQTVQDFIDLAAVFGVVVEVNPGVEEITFPLIFPVVMFTTEKEARFTLVIRFTVETASRFPLVFPIVFGDGEIAILECLFTKLKPANCDIIFQQV